MEILLTPEQRVVADTWRLDPDNPAWTVPLVVTVDGVRNGNRLQKAVQLFVDSADIFRIRLDPDHDSGAALASSEDRFTDIELMDFEDIPPDELASEINWMILDETEQEWDLFHDWPVRVNLLRTGEERWAVVFLFHRLVYHRGVKWRYMQAFDTALHRSADTETAGEVLPVSWFDYVGRMYQILTPGGDNEEKKLTYTEPVVPEAVEAGSIHKDLSAVRTDLQGLAEVRHLSWQDILLTGTVLWHYLFGRMGAAGVMVDLPDFAGGAATQLVGPTSRHGTVALSVTDNDTVAGLTRQVAQEISEAVQQTVAPAEFINAGQIIIREDAGARIGFRCHDLDILFPGEDGVRVGWSDADILSTEHDLEMIFRLGNNSLYLTLVFQQGLLGFDQAATWADELTSVISRMILGFDRPVAAFKRDLATERMARLAPATPPAPGAGIPKSAANTAGNPSLGDLFSTIADRFPDNIAIRTATYTIGYADLSEWVDRIARVLYSRAGRGGRIGILLDHGVSAVASILAVLKSGNAYVPLDVHMPHRRLQHMVDDADLSLVIVDTESETVWQDIGCVNLPVQRLDQINRFPDENSVLPDTAGRDDAYIIYTSGTTGTPKGVLQTQDNVRHFVDTYTRYLGITPQDVLTSMSAFMFDAAVLDIFTALLNGAALVMFDLKKEDFEAVSRRLDRSDVTIYHSTASVFRYFIGSLDPSRRFSRIRYAVLGGEPSLRSDLIGFRNHFAGDAVLVNLYGLSELTIGTMAFFGPEAEVVMDVLPIGGPITSVDVAVLDDNGHPAPGSGQLVFSGPCLAPRYWRRPELTAQKFPEKSDARTFLTGDVGEITAGGTLLHLGRKDFQLKIRGYRVEPGEIEACIIAHDQVAECVVHPVPAPGGEPLLAAFVITVTGASSSGLSGELGRFLKTVLPDYMIPRLFVSVPRFPKTASGKIDRRALEKMT